MLLSIVDVVFGHARFAYIQLASPTFWLELVLWTQSSLSAALSTLSAVLSALSATLSALSLVHLLSILSKLLDPVDSGFAPSTAVGVPCAVIVVAIQ